MNAIVEDLAPPPTEILCDDFQTDASATRALDAPPSPPLSAPGRSAPGRSASGRTHARPKPPATPLARPRSAPVRNASSTACNAADGAQAIVERSEVSELKRLKGLVAKVITAHGEVYVPIYERLEREILLAERRHDAYARALIEAAAAGA